MPADKIWKTKEQGKMQRPFTQYPGDFIYFLLRYSDENNSKPPYPFE